MFGSVSLGFGDHGSAMTYAAPIVRRSRSALALAALAALFIAGVTRTGPAQAEAPAPAAR